MLMLILYYPILTYYIIIATRARWTRLIPKKINVNASLVDRVFVSSLDR